MMDRNTASERQGEAKKLCPTLGQIAIAFMSCRRPVTVETGPWVGPYLEAHQSANYFALGQLEAGANIDFR
jgi:hypothetical protein